MTITNEHIKEASQILINGKEFDSERLDYIKNLNSCDLLAVPGSGKTTALLAKLYCLSKHLPLKNGAGILILGHTNETINNIEHNLKKYCPNLFEYPNFVGTIQGFIDKFLAIPYYISRNKAKIISINEVSYRKEIEYHLSQKHNGTIAYLKNRNPAIFYDARFRAKENGSYEIIDSTTNSPLNFTMPQKWDREGSADAKTAEVMYFIEETKISLLRDGVLHYDDCYFLADNYLYNYPLVKELLQHRFRYVFIDEMQDLEKFQIEIIDKIFLSEKSPTIIQRIGDINQAIYSSSRKVKVEADWQPRNPIMYIRGSNRLTSEVASVVNLFTLDRQKDDTGQPRFVVNGLRHLDTNIKPHLILFNNQTIGQLRNTFEEIIRNFSLQETIEGQKYGFKIIGWSAKWNDDEKRKHEHIGKLRLEDIFADYKKEKTENKESLDSLSKYLQYWDKKKEKLKSARDSILNALLNVLKLEEKKYTMKVRGKEVNRLYTKRELLKTIQEIDYITFKAKIYEWSFGLTAKENYAGVYNSIKCFIKQEFKDWFSLSITPEVENFLGVQFEESDFNDKDNQNERDLNGINIDIGTVHSAKGQTHCATMYVETANYGYETTKFQIVSKKATKKKAEEKLPNPLFGEEHSYRIGNDKRAKEAMKMMYVGFSRPTHLLCFAVLQENVKDDIQKIKDAGWEVIDITLKGNLYANCMSL